MIFFLDVKLSSVLHLYSFGMADANSFSEHQELLDGYQNGYLRNKYLLKSLQISACLDISDPTPQSLH